VNTLFDPTGYEIGLLLATPVLQGSGVFLNPLGVVNAASGAPGLDAISPGEFIALYGTGLAASTQTALPPYPTSVNGVSVTIGGISAPGRLVSARQTGERRADQLSGALWGQRQQRGCCRE
jgi:hypothetical protein